MSAALIDARGMTERLEHAVDTLRCALFSDDLLTARYAAATVTELGDHIETSLLAADRAVRAVAAGAVTYPSQR